MKAKKKPSRVQQARDRIDDAVMVYATAYSIHIAGLGRMMAKYGAGTVPQAVLDHSKDTEERWTVAERAWKKAISAYARAIRREPQEDGQG